MCAPARAGRRRSGRGWPDRDGLAQAGRHRHGAGARRRSRRRSRTTLERGDRLVRDLQASGVPLAEAAAWEALRDEWRERSAAGVPDEPAWEDLWRRVHQARRKIVFSNPLARLGPLLFVKQVPGIFSHQLTQYYGSCARPGGGVFVLDAPGRSLQCPPTGRRRPCPWAATSTPRSPSTAGGSCSPTATPRPRPRTARANLDRFYHLYEMAADGTGLRQLTQGPTTTSRRATCPTAGSCSSRRGAAGSTAAGRGPCPVYTLALADADGSNPRPISYHETHEWDPAVLHDGRVLYTRWDYVDRNAVFYEQLWTTRPDGTRRRRIFYGNNTFNPVGVWEARPVPGSSRVMATAAAHHAMTAGSIILLDVQPGRRRPRARSRG